MENKSQTQKSPDGRPPYDIYAFLSVILFCLIALLIYSIVAVV